MIYLDHHAATPTTAVVRQRMREASESSWANPSSVHRAGREARRLLERARAEVATAIGAAPADVVFTSGGTEACNLGIRGLASGLVRVVTTDVEHPAVGNSARRLQTAGRELVVLSVPSGVPPDPAALEPHLDVPSLVAIQWVNHETGTVFPIERYAETCRRHGARLFVDATQALGKLAVDVSSIGADAVAFAAQKIGGPAGAGACWVRRDTELTTVLEGGTQERGRWAGTPDTSSLVGFGAAAAAIPERLERQRAIAALRDRMESSLVESGGVVNGRGVRVASATNLSFRGWQGSVLVAALDVEGVCVSTGAACSSGIQGPSAVIEAMYPGEQWRAGSAVRISLGIETTSAEIDRALQSFHRVLARARAQNLERI